MRVWDNCKCVGYSCFSPEFCPVHTTLQSIGVKQVCTSTRVFLQLPTGVCCQCSQQCRAVKAFLSIPWCVCGGLMLDIKINCLIRLPQTGLKSALTCLHLALTSKVSAQVAERSKLFGARTQSDDKCNHYRNCPAGLAYCE